jgi:hypothetical protein
VRYLLLRRTAVPQEIFLDTRVTRQACEKIAQNVAQQTFCQNKYITGTYCEKKVAKNLRYFLNSQTQPNENNRSTSKNSPNKRKFAQSGHPVGYAFEASFKAFQTVQLKWGHWPRNLWSCEKWLLSTWDRCTDFKIFSPKTLVFESMSSWSSG